jgi:membrane peptidoglycan carboxypeptidase
MAVFLNCNNSDILAMAHYNPDEADGSNPTKLRAVTDQFEPGSVFKAFTAAGLLDAGVVDFSDSVNCENGQWRLGRRILHDDKELEWLNFRKVMELSSNIGMAKYALLLQGEELFEVYRRFGFGQKLRCGLPGETAGQLAPPSRWSDYNVAALAMGHSVAVSSLQLAAAFAAIANGGELFRPRLLLGRVDEDGYVVPSGGRELVGRAMDSGSVDSLWAILRGVVEHGTAEPANSPVVTIAGKTGTAEIPDLVNGGYLKNHFNASFAGFFPYESPVVAGIVVLEDPRPVTYGGHTAGPAFRRIAEQYTMLNPDAFITSERVLVAQKRRLENTIEAPGLIGREMSLARALAAERGVNLRSSSDEGIVVWQFPPGDRVLFEGDEMLVAVQSPVGSALRMADLTGLPIRTVAAFLHHAGIKYKVEGRGRVVTQSIRPGVEISDRIPVCRLKCRRT